MNLQFWQREAPKELLDGHFANVSTGMALDEYELSGLLLDHPLGSLVSGPGVDAVYETKKLRSEAHLYARDPSELKAALIETTVLAKPIGPPFYTQFWNLQLQPGALPQSVVLGPNVYTEQNKRSLSTHDFFPNVTPIGPAASPPGGSIKAVRVYNHGACSRQEMTTLPNGEGLLDKIHQALWDKFAREAILDDGECRTYVHPYRVSSAAMNYLDHTPGELRDLRGGFFLNLLYGTTIEIAANLEFNFTAWYEYQLTDGVLSLGTRYVRGKTVGYDAEVHGEALGEGLIECKPKNGKPCMDVPKGFYAAAKTAQTANILGTDEGFTPCQPEIANSCTFGVTMKTIAAINDGVAVLEALGEESFSGEERDRLKASLVEPVDDDSGVLKRWSCVPDRPDATKPGGPPGYHCEFTIPAKRLNIYPDAVELVWFDGKEVDNPAYAVYVLAHHPTGTNPSNGQPTFDQDNVDRLCSFEWDPYPRKFAISTLGFANDGAFFPEICGDGPYDTSPCSFGRPSSSTRPWWIPLVGLSLAVMRRRGRTPRLWS